MVTETLFVGLELDAGETSTGRLVDLADLGASGDFGLQVDTGADEAVTVTYKAAAAGTTPVAVADAEDVIAEHAGGSAMYWPSIMPASKIWVYVSAPAGGIGAEVSVTLNVF